MVWYVPYDSTVFLVVVWTEAILGLQDCPSLTYPDPITGSCQACKNLCDGAELHRTEQQCAFYCHDYNILSALNASSCMPGYYFNVALNSCGSCAMVCADNSREKTCREQCSPDADSKNLSTGLIVLIVLVLSGALVLGVWGALHVLRSGRGLSWRTSNPYRRPNTYPDDFDCPTSVSNDLAPLEDDLKGVGFSSLKMTIQNPIT